MRLKTEFQKIQSTVDGAKNILLLSHQNPDGDAIGCLTAFCQYAHILGKNYWAFCDQMLPQNFSFLPFREKIANVPFILKEAVDLVMIFDCSNLSHIGNKDMLTQLPAAIPTINIDHHHTNTYFGTTNIVLPEASSTSEILCRYFQEIRFPVNKSIAICLLSGIIGDTNTFTNHNTTPDTLEISAQLLLSGIPLAKVVDGTYKNKNIRILKQWGKALSQIYINKKYHGALAVLPLDKEGGGEDDQTAMEGFSNYLNTLSDVRWVMVLKEMPQDLIKGSLRTNSDLIDISKLATLLGGGGHKKAAGFTIKGKLVETENGWQVV